MADFKQTLPTIGWENFEGSESPTPRRTSHPIIARPSHNQADSLRSAYAKRPGQMSRPSRFTLLNYIVSLAKFQA